MIDRIEVFTQNSICISDSKGKIYIDPFQIADTSHDAAFLFLTHNHHDHYSPEDIRKVINSETVIVVPEKMLDTVKNEVSGCKEIQAVKPGMSGSVKGLEYDTVPAYNILKPFHPKRAGWVGYILHLDGQRIYIAGDTDATKEASEVKCDVAFVPIGGTYTMDAKKAAELVNRIGPSVAIPTHYGSIVGKASDGQVFARNVRKEITVIEKINVNSQ